MFSCRFLVTLMECTGVDKGGPGGGQARVTIRPGFPGHVLFLAFVRASGRVFESRRFVRVFGPIRKYIRTLPIAKAYDGMRQRKLVSFHCRQRNETSCMLNL